VLVLSAALHWNYGLIPSSFFCEEKRKSSLIFWLDGILAVAVEHVIIAYTI